MTKRTHSFTSSTSFKKKIITSIFRASSVFNSKRKMKSAAVFVLLACLLILHEQGQAKTSVRRCMCQGPAANAVRRRQIDKIEVYQASASCENVEIIVTLKNGAGKKCLNPKSEFTQKYFKEALGQKSAE